ncbi:MULTISPECIES: hypothetical protein [Comamonas]|uniref:Uncharacterized protein n=1 Tax=Comamonas aquatica TaxID=225991 RepID=A0AA42HUK5_9BURK|nr:MULTISPECIES: hypothetical protein [Comamonas]MDE1557036.1 hypothetical protein [Comamonas aquatica]MDH0364603.1 hypothetical protein [Comamonas aquatica]MDH0382868.1 hypothetical protein [Comamonas aquatica]MDH0430807.1 hypothetical protein [Comamonas aquatica]
MSAVKPVAAADRCTITQPCPAHRHENKSAQRIKIKVLTTNCFPNQDEFSASSSLF